MKSKEKASFGEWRQANELKNKIGECSWFAIIPGMAIAATMGVRSACHTGTSATVYAAAAAMGVILFLIGGFCPLILERPVRLLKKCLNFVGKTLLRLLLILLYPLFMLFSLPYILQGKRKHGFYSWDDIENDMPFSAFQPFQEQTAPSHSAAILRSINSIFSVFVRHKMLFLLPFVAILLVLGLVFFFVSSHSVFSFVYTLF